MVWGLEVVGVGKLLLKVLTCTTVMTYAGRSVIGGGIGRPRGIGNGLSLIVDSASGSSHTTSGRRDNMASPNVRNRSAMASTIVVLGELSRGKGLAGRRFNNCLAGTRLGRAATDKRAVCGPFFALTGSK